MKLYDGLANHPVVVRLFALERKGLSFDVEVLDVMNMENRRPAYRAVNPRGEVPALLLDDGRTVITEVTAICEYLDETAQGGQSLFGSNAAERAETRMRLRRADLEIAQPLIAWWRNDPATLDFYRGNRIPDPSARLLQKVAVNQGLNRLDDELEGRSWLCGDRFSAADIHLYGLVKPMLQVAEWANCPARPNVAAWFTRMDEREAVNGSMMPFKVGVSV